MARQRAASLYDDMVLFARVADRLESDNPPSLRTLAAEFNTTDYLLRAALDRVRDHLGVERVIHTSEKSAASTALTEEGRRFHQEFRKLLDWRPGSRPEVRIAMSYSLFTSRFLASALRRFKETHSTQIELHSRVDMDFNRILRDLQTDNLDLGVVFAADHRESLVYPGIERHEFKSARFEVVLIGTEQAKIDAHYREEGVLQSLSRRRVAALRADSQPGIARIPMPDRAAGGERIELDTVDAVVAAVMSGVAEFGVVVANYVVLEPLRRSGQLFYSPKLDETRLLGLTKRRPSSLARELLKAVEAGIPGLHLARPQSLRRSDFTTNPTDFHELKYGYYIDQPRGTERADGLNSPAWKWETIEWDEEGTTGNLDDKDRVTLKGTLRNLHDDCFEFVAERLTKRLFYVRAKQTRSVFGASEGFVSVFSWYGADEKFIFGNWTGIDADDSSRAAIYSTVWSKSPLGEARLNQISRSLKSQLFLEADRFVEFDRQPLD